MNVHRRDRARLRQCSPSSDNTSPTLNLQSHLPSDSQTAANYSHNLCLFYPLPSTNSISSLELSSPLQLQLSPSSVISNHNSFISASAPPSSSYLSPEGPSLQSPSDPAAQGSGSSFSASRSASNAFNCLQPPFPGHSFGAVSADASNSSISVRENRSYLGFSASLHNLKSETSRKKSAATGGFQPYQIAPLKNHETIQAAARLDSQGTDSDVDGLDLELRLGPKS